MATRRGGAPPIGPWTSPCRCCRPANRCASPFFPKVRTLMTSPASAARRPCAPCWTGRVRSWMSSGRARSKRDRSIRPREVVGAIPDDTLKRYYREEIETRLRALHPAPSPARGFGRERGPRGRDRQRRPSSLSAGLRASPTLARSTLFAGGAGISPREAFILGVLAAHPELLERHAETLAEIEFSSREPDALRSALLDCAGSSEASGQAVIQAVVQERLARVGLLRVVERFTERVRPGDRWALDPHADPVRLEDALRQAIVLHRKARALHTELRAAERALAEEG